MSDLTKPTGSLINNLYANGKGPAPKVGDGATELRHTDRRAGTIVEVSASGKRFVMQYDKATRADGLGMSDSQSYTYEADPNGPKSAFTLRKNGRYVREGESMKGGTPAAPGVRMEYYDYSF